MTQFGAIGLEDFVRIAKPILLVSTPIGVVWGVIEAYRFHAWLAGLMVLLLTVISAFMWLTVRTIRREQRESNAPAEAHRHDHSSG